ncbi:acylphosphatase [Impatiens glandulifera]|uniref:acylphosphatase n=1 Tax=Impatiens glandulifera TaxID=253017 RepID=UPI001FB12D45|nr:acylphosphatase [Impatiens glandulifera]
MAKLASSIFLKPEISSSQILLKSYANSFAGNAEFLTKQQFRFFHHHLHRSLPVLIHRNPISSLPLFRSRIMSSSINNPNSQPIKTVKVMVKGKVQGVFYRNWTIDNATELGLSGWVRNRRDGSVEAVFSGNPDKVQEMEDRCRRGPPSAIVTGLNVSPCNEVPGMGFERRSTV